MTEEQEVFYLYSYPHERNVFNASGNIELSPVRREIQHYDGGWKPVRIECAFDPLKTSSCNVVCAEKRGSETTFLVPVATYLHMDETPKLEKMQPTIRRIVEPYGMKAAGFGLIVLPGTIIVPRKVIANADGDQ